MVDNLQVDAVFAALADPTRREILLRLRRQPATVGDVAAPFTMSLNAVSKHIKVLERARLVRRVRRGREHMLSADPTQLTPAVGWLTNFQDFWEDRLDHLERAIEHLNTPTARSTE